MPKDKNSLKGFVDLSNTSQHAADSVMNKYFVGFPYSLPSQNEEHVSGIEDITDWVMNGYYPLYSRDGMPGYSFFTDGSGKVYRVSDAENINTSGMSPLSYSEMRKMLPKREYIGGKDYRFRTAQRIPGFLDKIRERAEAYGIDPNLVLNRILREGWIDQQVLNYNGLDASQQGGYWNGLWDAPVSGYGSFGLDYAGNNLMNGVYELKDPDASWRSAEFTDYDGGNSFRAGTSLEADNLSSAIEILAAELAYRQREVAKRYGKKGSDLNVWTNAAFNMGLNNDDFKNEDWVRKQYTYPDYYGQIETRKKLGGIIERFGADRLQQYFSSGGSIRIKPSHRGRLTELKERTDKTEEELYNDGNPAHKKMVVFARNARKWKHADGGPLLRSFDMGGDKDNDALAKAIIARVNQEEAAKARAEGAPMMGEKPLESEDYLLGLAAIGANAPIAGTVSAVKEVAPLWGRAGLRMLKDLPAFEFVDRLPTLFGGKRMTELGGDATQAAYEGITGNHNLSDMSRALVRMPGEFIAGVVPGVAGDMLMRTGSNAVLRSLNNRGIRIDGSMDYLEPLAHETNVSSNELPFFGSDSFPGLPEQERLYRIQHGGSGPGVTGRNITDLPASQSSGDGSVRSGVQQVRPIGRIVNFADVVSHRAEPQVQYFDRLTQDAINARSYYNDIRNSLSNGTLTEDGAQAFLDFFAGDGMNILNDGLVTRDGLTDFLNPQYISSRDFYDLRRLVRDRRNSLGSARVARQREGLIRELRSSELTPARLEEINTALGDLYENSVTFGVDAYSDALYDTDVAEIGATRQRFLNDARRSRSGASSSSAASNSVGEYDTLEDAFTAYNNLSYTDFSGRRALRDQILSSDALRDAISSGRTSFPTGIKSFVGGVATDMFNNGAIDENNALIKEMIEGIKKDASRRDLQSLLGRWFGRVFDESGANDNSGSALRKLMGELGTSDYREALRVVDDYDNQPQKIRDIINSAYSPNRYVGYGSSVDKYTRLENEIYENALMNKLRESGIENVSPESLVNPEKSDFLSTVTRLRELGVNDLPADIHHQYWFQVRDANRELEDLMRKYNMTPDELSKSYPEEYNKVQKEIANATMAAGIQSRMLQRALPRGAAIAEHNTSADSYRVMARGAVNSPGGYGYSPGQTSIIVHRKPNGDVEYSSGNKAHQNRIMFDSHGNLYAPKEPSLNGLFTRSELEKLKSAVADSGKTYFEYVEEHPEYKPLLEKVIQAVHSIDEGNVKSISSVFSSINRRFGESLPMPEVKFPERLEDARNSEVRDIIDNLLHESGRGSFTTYMKRPTISVLKHKYGGFIERYGKDKILSAIAKMKQSK